MQVPAREPLDLHSVTVPQRALTQWIAVKYRSGEWLCRLRHDNNTSAGVNSKVDRSKTALFSLVGAGLSVFLREGKPETLAVVQLVGVVENSEILNIT